MDRNSTEQYSSNQIIVRDASAEDAQAIMHIWNSNISSTLNTFNSRIKTELEIKKLEDFLSIDDLYLSDQKKFDKASSALAERKLKIDKIMEEWLLLEDKQIYGQLS